MWEATPVGTRHEPLEVALDLDRIFLPRQPEPLREPAHVRIDHDPLRVAQLGGDDVRGLAGDAGQPDEFLEAARDTAVELLEQHPHRASQRLRLLTEETGRPDVV